MSLGTARASGAMQSAIAYAVSHGIVVVASAGNSAAPGQKYTPYSYPASFTGVIAVGAVGAAAPGPPSPTATHPWCSPHRGWTSSGPAGRQLSAGQRDQPGVGFRGRGGRADQVGVPAAVPGPGGTGAGQFGAAPAGRAVQPGHGFGEVDAAAALRAAGRLAATRPAPGLAAGSRFGPARPGRCRWFGATRRGSRWLGGLAVAGAVGFLAALAVLGRLIAVRRRGRPPPSARGPGTGPASTPGRLTRPVTGGRGLAQGRVRISWPLAVTSTVCSNCAVRL